MHLTLQNVSIILICFCTKFINLINCKSFLIHHENVPPSVADLLLVIETTSKTVNASTLAAMKAKTLGLLDQLDIANDKVRVALIQNGENKYQDPDVKTSRSFNDIASVVKCKLNECNDPTVLRSKINEMGLKEFTPCSLPILAAEQIIFKRQNGDRPDVNNVVIFIQSFCCDDTNQVKFDQKTMKHFIKTTTTVFVSLFVESACNGSFHVAQSYATRKEFAFRLRDYDYSNKEILNVIQKVLSCNQKAEVGKCKWNSNEKTCKRTLAIDPIEDEKCAKAIDKPFSDKTYFSEDSEICAEVIDMECRPDANKTYRLLPQLRQRIPNSKIEQNIPRFTPEYDLRMCLSPENNFPLCNGLSIPMPEPKERTLANTASPPAFTSPLPVDLTTTSSTSKELPSTFSNSTEEVKICEQFCNGTEKSNQCAENVDAWAAHSNVSSYPCLKTAEKSLAICRQIEGKGGCGRLANALSSKNGSQDKKNSSFPLYAIIIIVIVAVLLISILILALVLKCLMRKTSASSASRGLATKESVTKEAAIAADLTEGKSRSSSATTKS